MVVIRAPGTGLSGFVESVWYYESHHAHREEIVLPSARAQLLIYLSSSSIAGSIHVAGPTTQPTSIETAHMRRMVGVTFRPGSARYFIGAPCNELCDRALDFADVSRVRASSLLASRVMEAPSPERMIEAVETTLLRTAQSATPDHAMIAHAIRWLDAGVRVADVVDRVGSSRSRFVRTFVAHVGTTPKAYAGLSRFRRALSRLARGERDLARLAVDCGYFDQAHFCHEFQRFARRSPTEYQPRDPAEPSHLVV